MKAGNLRGLASPKSPLLHSLPYHSACGTGCLLKADELYEDFLVIVVKYLFYISATSDRPVNVANDISLGFVWHNNDGRVHPRQHGRQARGRRRRVQALLVSPGGRSGVTDAPAHKS